MLSFSYWVLNLTATETEIWLAPGNGSDITGQLFIILSRLSLNRLHKYYNVSQLTCTKLHIFIFHRGSNSIKFCPKPSF